MILINELEALMLIINEKRNSHALKMSSKTNKLIGRLSCREIHKHNLGKIANSFTRK